MVATMRKAPPSPDGNNSDPPVCVWWRGSEGDEGHGAAVAELFPGLQAAGAMRSRIDDDGSGASDLLVRDGSRDGPPSWPTGSSSELLLDLWVVPSGSGSSALLASDGSSAGVTAC
ncbi:hypothetical protein E2562_033024 [Oryza meyeriana var. granulata]|uniref:Uncharacterized protein n=1 Tax=Oryza meyeriana var. granulata TaxID=110450 RepID=A0A6G1CVV2_9ORYZ|nr:hypothetical protein E2562_033024 [Oryza meyeriana var. granulata]